MLFSTNPTQLKYFLVRWISTLTKSFVAMEKEENGLEGTNLQLRSLL